MDNAKLGLISLCKEFSNAVLQMARKLSLDIIFHEVASIKKALYTAQEWDKGNQIDAIVYTDILQDELKNKINIPVISVHVSNFDIAEALIKAKLQGSNIALLNMENQFENIDHKKIKAITKVNYQVIPCHYANHIDEVFHQALKDNTDVILSNDINLLNQTEKYGVKPVFITYNNDNICHALKKAWEIGKLRRKNIKSLNYMEHMLNNTHDGILVIEHGIIVIFNSVAEKLTGIKAQNAIGKPIYNICHKNIICRELYNNGKVIHDQLLNIEDLLLKVNCVSIKSSSKNNSLLITFRMIDKVRKIPTYNNIQKNNMASKFRFSDIIGHSAMIQEAIREARKYARSEATILITGESGTGKELFAQSLHNESNRQEGPFVAVNCAALPESLLESELFGYEDGAFTGARKGGKQGLFSLANGGTIFLDEVGELSPALQARLLRVLQEKEVMPVGGQRVLPVDVKVISATNQNLKKAVDEGRYRKDLYYRLNILNLYIPPLRDRLEDVPKLFKYFIGKLIGPPNRDFLNLDDTVLEELKKYHWPGNVRELEGFVERYVALGEENISAHTTFYKLLSKLTIKDITTSVNNNKLTIELGDMKEMERQILMQAQMIIQGGKSEMARVLGVSRTTLWKKLRELGEDDYESIPWQNTLPKAR